MPFTGYFPLRWESTGDQWWFACPIDYAAAKGHYDLVRELLHIDPNLLIKLTSLPRIRRLESVWDDEEEDSTNNKNIAKSRAHVAHKLLRECDASKGHDSLIRAGYGGWLLYAAASAGDVIFVKELLDRDPFLVFGEGEFGVTDILYAASRSKNCEVFRLLLDCSLSLKEQQNDDMRSEMMNRAVHALARGGNVEMLRELLRDKCDVLDYRDAQGSSLLHTASGRGQVQVIKYLISSYDGIITSVDYRGNTALHVAAFRGQLTSLEILLSNLSPSLASVTNDDGDTFLHMAISGFHASGFRRMDKQIDLMKCLLSGNLISLEHIINVQNNEGRTVLHMAVIEALQSDIVEQLMSVCYASLNECDKGENTPLDLLKGRPRSPSSEILIKRLVSFGGVSNHHDEQMRASNVVSRVRTLGIVGSPGTSFGIPDSDIILCTAMDDTCPSSCELTTSEHGYSSEINDQTNPIAESYTSSKLKRFSSVNKATTYLKILLRKPAKKKAIDAIGDDCSVESYRTCNGAAPVPLRQQYATVSSFPNNKRILSLKGRDSPSRSMKKKVANRSSFNYPYVLPKSSLGSPSSYCSSPVFVDDDNRRRGLNLGTHDSDVPCSMSYHSSPHNEKHHEMKLKHKHGSFNMRLMNKYLCFGAQGLAIEDSISSRRHTQIEQTLVV